MTPTQRIQFIQDQLHTAFSPDSLEILDDSERHKGHAGSQGGGGHYTIIIKSRELSFLSRIEAHRKIYAELKNLIPHEIHALIIKILP